MSLTLTIEHDQEACRFAINCDGVEAYLSYMNLGQNTLDIYRTFVPTALRGKGLASRLTQAALDYAHDAGFQVIPSCSYVERYMQRQARYAATRSEL